MNTKKLMTSSILGANTTITPVMVKNLYEIITNQDYVDCNFARIQDIWRDSLRNNTSQEMANWHELVFQTFQYAMRSPFTWLNKFATFAKNNPKVFATLLGMGSDIPTQTNNVVVFAINLTFYNQATLMGKARNWSKEKTKKEIAEHFNAFIQKVISGSSTEYTITEISDNYLMELQGYVYIITKSSTEEISVANYKSCHEESNDITNKKMVFHANQMLKETLSKVVLEWQVNDVQTAMLN